MLKSPESLVEKNIMTQCKYNSILCYAILNNEKGVITFMIILI